MNPNNTTIKPATPRTDVMACKIGFHATAWKRGMIDAAKFEELVEKELNESRNMERELIDVSNSINDVMEECGKHVTLSNDFPWTEEIYCTFRHFTEEIAALKSAEDIK